MKFELLGDWPATGAICIPAGTIIDGNDLQWNGVPLRVPMPLNAKALDQEGLDALAYWHAEERYHLFHYASGLRLPKLHYPPPAPQRKDTSL